MSIVHLLILGKDFISKYRAIQNDGLNFLLFLLFNWVNLFNQPVVYNLYYIPFTNVIFSKLFQEIILVYSYNPETTQPKMRSVGRIQLL